jgi:transaldolase
MCKNAFRAMNVSPRDALALARDKSINFEVFSGDFPATGKQTRLISSWGKNVSVKLPISKTGGGVSTPTPIHTLSANGISINVTTS